MLRFFKELGKAFIIGNIIFIVFLVSYYIKGTAVFFDEELLYGYLDTLVYAVAIYMANAYTWIYFGKKYGAFQFTLKSMVLGICSNIGISLLAIFLVRAITKVGFGNMSFGLFLEEEDLTFYYIAFLIALVLTLLFYLFYYYKYRQENKVKEQKIIAGTASAKFDALKNQLDPHFLFNSLNVLTSLIEEDPAQAQKFTTSLSKVYRYVLEQKNKDLVTVDEELEFAKTYVRLLKMRFEDSIVFNIPERSNSPEAKIIPLSLQLLLENAVKHNVVTSKRPLTINVFEKNGMLCVSNNLQEKQVVKKSSGVGLHNIRQRYQILTDKKVIINKTASEFSVQLPMLIKQISIMETQESYIDEKRYQKAKERVEAIKSFYGNLVSYCIVIPILVYINYKSTSFPWVIFPALGWGFGVIAHGMEAYGYNPIFGKSWEERKMKEYMEDENF
ncbi:2TM domain-containing protein [Sediminicola sp. 1XM1-17]|uniref:2TM domain-containing protein n=1 Tax=Sediminicola sp. 1XM1-17 TaxID=3127702 RepID=UPI00307779DE